MPKLKLGDLSSKVFQGQNNLINMVKENARQIRAHANKNLPFNALDSITNDLGDVTAGRFIAIDTSQATAFEPNATGFYGAFVSAMGELFGSVLYAIGVVKDGVLQAGMSLSGDFFAVGGSFVANALGVFIKAVGGATYISLTSTAALFGSDISNPNTTFFSIFFTAQTYNGESIEAGSVMMGSNSASFANVLWLPSTKILYFRGGTTPKLWINTTGNMYVTNSQFITFLDTGGAAKAGVASDGANNIVIQNNTASAGVTLGIVTTDLSSPQITWDEDNANANVSQLTVNASSGGAKQVIGSGIVLWSDKDGTETVFNENSKNIDLRVEGDTDANLLFTDASADRVGIGNNAPTVKLDVTGAGKFSGALQAGAPVTIAESSTPSTPASGFGAFYPKTDNNPYFINDAGTERQLATGSGTVTGTNTGDQTLRTSIGGFGNLLTVGIAGTQFLGPYQSGGPSATEADVRWLGPYTGTLQRLRFVTRTAQPATGNMVITTRVANADTSIVVTVAAGAAAGTFSDVSNTASVTGGNPIALKIVNNGLAVSAMLGTWSMEYDAS